MKIEVGKEYKVLKDGLKEGLREGEVGTVVSIDSLGVCTLRHVCTGGWTESLIESSDLTAFTPSKPLHYDTDIDPITFAKANFSREAVQGFMRISAIKYLQRDKGQNLSDLKKAADFVRMLIEMEEEDNEENRV